VLGKAIRGVGKSLDAAGKCFEIHPNVDALIPATTALKYQNALPTTAADSFIAPSATLVGKVTIGKQSSIWYGAVLRGDDSTITIGDKVSIGDRVMIHCSGGRAGLLEAPTVIGNRSIVGAGAILHGCILEEETFVGKGSQVLDGAKICKHGALAPGSLLSMGKVIPSGQLWAGVPAVYAKTLTPAEIQAVAAEVNETVVLAKDHAEAIAKPWVQAEHEEYLHEQELVRSPHYYVPDTDLDEKTYAQVNELMEGEEGKLVPGRVFNSEYSGRQDRVLESEVEAELLAELQKKKANA